MAKNNSGDQQFNNAADGFRISGGTTSRELTVTGGDVNLTAGSDTVLTLPTTDTLVGRASTDTLTNKNITPRVLSAASYTTSTGSSLDMDNLDKFYVTAQAGALLFNSPGGTLVQGQSLVIRIEDNGTARALTWNAIFRAMGTALPSTTVLGKVLYLGFYYDTTDTKWDLVASAQEA